jgi:hypothetical protein
MNTPVQGNGGLDLKLLMRAVFGSTDGKCYVDMPLNLPAPFMHLMFMTDRKPQVLGPARG